MLPAKVPSPGPNNGSGTVVADATRLPVLAHAGIPVVPRKTPAALSPIPDTGALLHSLRRRWWVALVLGVAALAGSAVGLWKLLPHAYTVRTLLHVAPARQPVLGPTYTESLIDFTNYQKTQVAIVKSRLILQTALDQPQVKSLPVVQRKIDPVEWLENDLKVDFKLAPEVLSIAMTGQQPEQLAVIVNAVRDVYLTQVVNKERNEKMSVLQRLQAFFQEKENFLQRRRDELKKQAEASGSRDAQTLAQIHQFALERLNMAQRELMQIQSDLRKAEATDKAEKSLTDDGVLVTEKEIAEEMQKDETLAALVTQVGAIEQEAEQLRSVSRLGDKDPSYVNYQAKIKAARAAVQRRQDTLRPAIVARLRGKYEKELAEAKRRQKKDLVVAQELARQLKTEVAELEKKASSINKGTIELGTIKEDITQAEEAMKSAGRQMDNLKVELSAPSRVSLLEGAVVSHSEEDKKRMKVIGAGSLGSFALVLLGVVLWDHRGRRINKTEDLSHGLGLPVLAVLPRMPRQHAKDATHWNVSEDGYVYDEWIESVNAARTMILNAARDDAMKVVMVASALEGEGKTSLACHLAASLAHKFNRVLLLDGDLRKPSVHKRMQLGAAPGLSELLRSEASLPEVVQATSVKNLFVMSAGECDYQATQLLAQDRLHEVFAELKKEFDFIVVDSSPLLHVADPLSLAQQVDAVLFSVLREVSRLPAVYAAYEKVLMLGVRVLGTIVHGMPARKRSYAYTLSYR